MTSVLVGLACSWGGGWLRAQESSPEDAKFKSLGQLRLEAGNYRKQGQLEAAAATGQKAVDMAEEFFGRQHPQTGGMLMDLGATSFKRGEYEEAERLLQEALAIFEEFPASPPHEEIAALRMMTNVYASQGKRTEAIQFQQRADARGEIGLNGADEDWGRFSKGLLQQMQDETQGQELDVLAAKVLALREQGRFESAAVAGKKVVDLAEKHLGRQHLRTAGALLDLGVTYMNDQQAAKAEPLVQDAIAIFEQKPELEPSVKIVAFRVMANVYVLQGKDAEAIHFQERADALGDLGEPQADEDWRLFTDRPAQQTPSGL